MKKVLFMAVAVMVAATSFSQTDKQKKAEVKAAEKKAVAETKKATTEVKKAKAEVKEAKKEVKEAKELKAKASKEMSIAPKPVDAVKPTVESLEKETAAAQAVQPAPVVAQPAPLADVSKAFEFKNDAFDFGKIPAGKPSKYDLFIKNVSKETQELTLVQPGCGCTTPEYEQNKKFAPGETVKVTLGYNGGAAGNGSPFSKSVTVTLKGFQPKIVTFKGETYAVPTESAPANGAIDKLKPAAEETKH